MLEVLNINRKFKAKNLQNYTGYQKGIKERKNEKHFIRVLIIFCNLNQNKFLWFYVYKVCRLFYSFSPVTSKMGLELIRNAKFDAFHSHSLLAIQVA